MALFVKVRSFLRNVFSSGRVEADLEQEVQAHLEMLVEEKLRAGMAPAEAQRVARLELGGVEQVKEQVREERVGACLQSVISDSRVALRQFRKNPGFTAIAVITLALGIGTTTATFTVVNSALLRPLAYHDPQRLYLVREIVPQLAKFYPTLSANLPNYRIWREQVSAFGDVAIAEASTADTSGHGQAEVLRGVRCSANLFSVLGVQPILGRSFQPEEDEPGRGQVVILTEGFWRNRFQGDPRILQKSITLNGIPHQIVGVLPATFPFPQVLGGTDKFSRLAFFKPLNGPEEYERGLIGEFDFAAVARLKPGVSEDQALVELNLVQGRIAKQANEGVDLQGTLLPLQSEVVGTARQGLIFLLAAVGAVLLIVCANLASLLLARVPGRMREAAIRAALGGSHARIVRQFLTESLLLAAAGGALGLAVAAILVRWLVSVAPPGIPRLNEVQMDGRVLLFAVTVIVATACIFGIFPALRSARCAPVDALKSGAAATTESHRTRRLRESLVGFEVGVTALLLVLAGLLMGSLGQLLRVHTGFAPENVLIAEVDLPPQNYSKPEDRLDFYDGILSSMQALPGVRATGWVSIPPLGGEGSVTGITIPGAQQAHSETPVANYRPVSADYFAAMGIPLLKGRVFTAADQGRKVVVVSQSVAERFWPGRNPIGETCITQWGPDAPAEVIGVVGDIRTVRLDEAPVMMVYVPHWFNTISVPTSAAVVLRTTGDPGTYSGSVRDRIHQLNPDVPVTNVQPMAQVVSESLESRRFPMFLAAFFALTSLLLASLGIFGVVGYSVEQRRHELAIRIALGAEVRGLLCMVLRQGMTPVFMGLAGGVIAAVVVGRLMASMLFGVSASDPVTLGAVVAIVGAIGCVACYLPARRASRVDPMVALRYE